MQGLQDALWLAEFAVPIRYLPQLRCCKQKIHACVTRIQQVRSSFEEFSMTSSECSFRDPCQHVPPPYSP